MTLPSNESNNNNKNLVPFWCPEQQIYVGGNVPSEMDDEIIEQLLEEENGMLRIFGYGSLCWKPSGILSHPSVTTCMGRAIGWKRCWAQKSADHRGTPEFPGIVCTLLNDQEYSQITDQNDQEKKSMTEGVLYSIPPDLVKDCLSELDFREKGGYSRDVINVSTLESDHRNVKALLYRGTPENPAFWKRPLIDLPFAAGIMSMAIGPSGRNDEYLYHLDGFLSESDSTSIDVQTDGDVITRQLAEMTRQYHRDKLIFQIFGCGSNQYHQLLLPSFCLMPGEDYTTNASLQEIHLVVPKLMNLNSGTQKVKSVHAGGGHSALLTQEGILYLWGWNEHGQLGRLDEPFLENVDFVTLGHGHTIFIEKDTKRLYAMGDNSRGQVDPLSKTTKITKPIWLYPDQKFIDASAGVFHSAAITVDGELLTFGHSKYTLPNKWKPEDGSRLFKVVCGHRHTVLLDEYGRVWTFGDEKNKYNQLGRQSDTSSNKTEPQLVDGILGQKNSGCIEIDCGWSHCVALVKNEDSSDSYSLYGWGRNDKGQLGIKQSNKSGRNDMVNSPTKIFDTVNICSVSCGSECTMLVDKNKDLWACGWNEHNNIPDSNKHVLEWIMIDKNTSKIVAPINQNVQNKILLAAGGAHFLTMLT